MGAKLAIVFFMLMVAMAGVGSWYYKQTQQKIATLQENNAKLEVAVDTAESSIATLQADALKSAELWAIKFECSLPAYVETIGEDTLYIFKNCKDNKEVRYLRVENGQHNLHKQNSNLFVDIWQFFKRL